MSKGEKILVLASHVCIEQNHNLKDVFNSKANLGSLDPNFIPLIYPLFRPFFFIIDWFTDPMDPTLLFGRLK